MDIMLILYYYLISEVLIFLSVYMFLEAVVETSGDCLWQNEKFLCLIITKILIDSDEYGRDAIVISVVGKTNTGNSKHSDYCCMTLKLISK